MTALNYENVSGLPANPTVEQEAFASIAQSLKRMADILDAREAKAEPDPQPARDTDPVPATDAVPYVAVLRHHCARSGYHDHDGCSCSDSELLVRDGLGAARAAGITGKGTSDE